MNQARLKPREEPVALLPPPEGEKPKAAGRDTAERKGSRWPLALVALGAVALLGYGGWRHWQVSRQADETQAAQKDFVPTVRVTEAKREDQPNKLTLPGQTEAFRTATLYARATGYIAERYVDIGARVKKGQLLLKIAAPDVDAQLAQAQAQAEQTEASIEQARAQLTQAQAQLELQKTNLARANTLAKQGFETAQNQQTQQTTVASQEAALVTAKAGIKVSEANLKAQQAAVERLSALTGFEKVVAPFDGVVTQRNVDIGDLVNADQGTGTSLFRVDEEDVLRVFVQVPQYASDGVRDGLAAEITAPQMAGRSFSGKVSRTSVALMYSSRTLTTEVDIANPDGTLKPGQYVDVAFAIPRTMPDVQVPADALVFNQKGLMVATVEEDGTAKFHKVEVNKDLGTELQLKDGLKGGEKVILDPPPTLADGAKVKVAQPEPKPTNVAQKAE